MELWAERRAERPVARGVHLLGREAVEDLEERLRLLATRLGSQAVRGVDVDPHLAGVVSTIGTVGTVGTARAK